MFLLPLKFNFTFHVSRSSICNFRRVQWQACRIFFPSVLQLAQLHFAGSLHGHSGMASTERRIYPFNAHLTHYQCFTYSTNVMEFVWIRGQIIGHTLSQCGSLTSRGDPYPPVPAILCYSRYCSPSQLPVFPGSQRCRSMAGGQGDFEGDFGATCQERWDRV